MNQFEKVSILQDANTTYSNSSEPLTGITQTPNQRIRKFGNLSALTNYIKTFNIQQGQFLSETSCEGEVVFVLVYPLEGV